LLATEPSRKKARRRINRTGFPTVKKKKKLVVATPGQATTTTTATESPVTKVEDGSKTSGESLVKSNSTEQAVEDPCKPPPKKRGRKRKVHLIDGMFSFCIE
jgi:hypothetical protein